MTKNIIIIILVAIMSIAAIRPSKQQVVLTYNAYTFETSNESIKKDLNKHFMTGYRVIDMVSWGRDYPNHILIVLER